MKRVWLCGRQIGTVFTTLAYPTLQNMSTHPYHPYTLLFYLFSFLSESLLLSLPSLLRSDELVKLALIMQACLKPQKPEMESE